MSERVEPIVPVQGKPYIVIDSGAKVDAPAGAIPIKLYGDSRSAMQLPENLTGDDAVLVNSNGILFWVPRSELADKVPM